MKTMDLPLSYTNDQDFSKDITMEFVFNDKTERPLQMVFDNHLFMLYKVFFRGELIDYQLQIYDIREPMHNSIILKESLITQDAKKDDLNFDFSFAKLQVVKTRDAPDDLYAIIINMNEDEQVIYKFDPNNALLISHDKKS